ncbi:MAG: hypothetical protein BWY67_02102 [Bacteroidetes bacterium ADurb.Bin397]|nr:MAG: hypothetical protein BWY67_02102 [Bacteroidetes bacterium ADurb.Bin397]
MKVAITKSKLLIKVLPFFLWMSITCAAPTRVSHGTNDAFSTGSHAQKPPKLNASYAHAAPINIPVPKVITPKNDQLRAGVVHSFNRLVIIPAIANANGIKVAANPRNSTGG